jgi:hypothetical protein
MTLFGDDIPSQQATPAKDGKDNKKIWKKHTYIEKRYYGHPLYRSFWYKDSTAILQGVRCERDVHCSTKIMLCIIAM